MEKIKADFPITFGQDFDILISFVWFSSILRICSDSVAIFVKW